MTAKQQAFRLVWLEGIFGQREKSMYLGQFALFESPDFFATTRNRQLILVESNQPCPLMKVAPFLALVILAVLDSSRRDPSLKFSLSVMDEESRLRASIYN